MILLLVITATCKRSLCWSIPSSHCACPVFHPQVAGEFIGGSDIMIEMYQNGELGELIEKAVADM